MLLDEKIDTYASGWDCPYKLKHMALRIKIDTYGTDVFDW